jgi:hypothetical protein
MRNLLLFSLLVLGTAFGQVASNRVADLNGDVRSRSDADVRLLTWGEGVQIIKVAWKNLSKFDAPIDCSHLVNQIYELAGLHYQYATSNELYRGVDGFEQVRTPQPADLIVWPGHVGVVVNPQEHSFYSSLNSGLKMDEYDSPVWRARGPARFFRFVVQNREQIRTGASESVTTRAQKDEFESSPNGSRAISTLGSNRQPREASAASADDVFLNGERLKKDAVQRALLIGWGNASDDRQERWQEAPEKIIVEALKIERISLKGDNGTLETRIKSPARFTSEEMQVHSSMIPATFHLVRAQNGWKINDPTRRMYLSGDAAVVAISEHLAGIARENASRAEQAEAAALLHSLLR